MSVDEDALEKALDWLDDGRRVAVATVVQTWGSSPRPAGSQLAVRDDGLFAGSVSGGCVEAKVVEAALEALEDGAYRSLSFGVSNDEAWEVGLACGGTVRIHVAPVGPASPAHATPLDRAVLERIRHARREKRAIVLLTPLDGDGARAWSSEEPPLDSPLREAVARAIVNDEAVRVETSAGAVLALAFNPPRRLVIVGAVHVARPLVAVAELLGYAVTVVDPREAFARADRWPGASVVNDWPDTALGAFEVDARTAIVVLSHDPKIDDPALDAALRSPAFYVGALGSTKTHAARLSRLEERGFGPGALARVHGPVGLRIGASTPAEIAIAIAAQMTEALRRPAGPKP